MYPGESIIEVGGYPALVRFEPGRAGSSLVVFITGGGVLARIAYGHPGGRACDFLAYWLHQEGFASLALSYPMGNAVFDRAYPDFSVVDWGEQSAEIIALHVKAHELPRRVIVMGWSMAGRIVEPITAALHQRDIEVELFVAMAAATPLPNLLPALSAMRPAASGLASVAGAYAEVLLANLQEQSRDAGHVILDPVIFSTQFMGDYPVRLSASAMRYNNGTFIPDPLGDQHQTGAWRYSALPPLALMTHEAKLDARHALMDRATWGFYITQSLSEARVFAQATSPSVLAPAKWTRINDLIHAAPARLTMIMPGNHMFFVGEKGARSTVAALEELRTRMAALIAELAEATRP
jgi:hypothetical protein